MGGGSPLVLQRIFYFMVGVGVEMGGIGRICWGSRRGKEVGGICWGLRRVGEVCGCVLGLKRVGGEGVNKIVW